MKYAFNLTLASLLAFSLLASGCKDSHNHDHDDHSGHSHAEGDGHDHGPKKPTPAATPAKPDAGHDDHNHDDHQDEIRLTPQAIERWNITLAQAKVQPLTETFTVPARVSYNLEAIAHVGSLTSGRVSAIHARTGDQVKQGDVLLEISSPELGQAQSDFLQKRAAITAAESSLRIATTLHDNAKKLHQDTQGIALSEVQKREADMLTADAALKAAHNAIAAAKNHLLLAGMDEPAIHKLIETDSIDPRVLIRSPLTGRVIDRSVAPGEAISADRDALFIIANLDTLWVLADVPESYIGKVEKQGLVTIHAPASPQRKIQGTISHIAPELDPATRTLSVRIEISHAESLLKPGMFVQADITSGDKGAPILAIPESAMQTIEGQPCIFVPVPGEPNTFTKRVIKLGPQVGRLLPVVDGLKEGETFVATGSFILKADLGKSGAGHEH